jgi:hypothetical protein
MEEDKFIENYKKKKSRLLKRVLLVAVILLIIGVPVFFWFRLKTEGRLALREAKNIKLAFETLSVEYYGLGLSIYDSSSASGLTAGVKERLSSAVDADFEVLATGYNSSTRTITAFDYTNQNYMVRYSYDEEKGDTWKVYYKYLVYDY